jgi:hypothetical protein
MSLLQEAYHRTGRVHDGDGIASSNVYRNAVISSEVAGEYRLKDGYERKLAVDEDADGSGNTRGYRQYRTCK